jgi:hypothetical protein
MNTLSEQETPAFQWHFLLVLLPFSLGIYLADYRNLTDTAIYFFKFETILSVVFICFGRSRQWALLGLSTRFLVAVFCTGQLYNTAPICIQQ